MRQSKDFAHQLCSEKSQDKPSSQLVINPHILPGKPHFKRELEVSNHLALCAAFFLPWYGQDKNGPFLVKSEHPKGISEPGRFNGAGESHPSYQRRGDPALLRLTDHKGLLCATLIICPLLSSIKDTVKLMIQPWNFK